MGGNCSTATIQHNHIYRGSSSGTGSWWLLKGRDVLCLDNSIYYYSKKSSNNCLVECFSKVCIKTLNTSNDLSIEIICIKTSCEAIKTA